jgi:hypothetical protein
LGEGDGGLGLGGLGEGEGGLGLGGRGDGEDGRGLCVCLCVIEGKEEKRSARGRASVVAAA